jgi:Mrp family chromosome partitioning ATPase/predicted Fe-Mo cluster-binding NifX family protein
MFIFEKQRRDSRMSEKCNNDYESCEKECSERKEKTNDFAEALNDQSNVGKVFGIVSGKGGVGKSLITSMMAVAMQRKGKKTAILDADITGPSIPKAFGIKAKAVSGEAGIEPVKSKTGIDIMSINLLLNDDTDPIVWRGPLIANTVKQFWSEVIWGDIDYMFIDMPPGTGDVPLTVFQSIPVDGIIVVTSPQELVSMIVSKAVKMAEMMKIPVLGLVENMSYFHCPDNGLDYKIFGESHIEAVADKYGINILGKMPIDPRIAKACDDGEIENINGNWLEGVVDKIDNEEGNKIMKIAVASEEKMVTEHFGHCVNFNIFEIEGGKITKSESLSNPGHKPGFLPNYLNDMGVNVIISGGMGAGAIDIFNEKNIEVIVGASGSAEEAVKAYLAGTLKSTGSVCHEHMYVDECGE